MGDMDKEEDYHIITLSVDKERHDYLQRNPGINRSKIFREKVDEIRYGELFYFDYQLFILKVIVALTISFLLFLLLPIQFLFLLPLVFGFVAIYILMSAIIIIARNQERMKYAKQTKRDGRNKGTDN